PGAWLNGRRLSGQFAARCTVCLSYMHVVHALAFYSVCDVFRCLPHRVPQRKACRKIQLCSQDLAAVRCSAPILWGYMRSRVHMLISVVNTFPFPVVLNHRTCSPNQQPNGTPLPLP
ncbi:unnamed protein product, partial [Ectocarpus sp. 4 AP-2014]